jgi:exopolysaccharide biosynthesis polyprenyl glycosylphosphotransferase
MESSVATQAETLAALDVAADPPLVQTRRRRLERSSVLARALAGSDLAVTLTACAVGALATGIAAREALAFAAVGALLFPLLMFFLGVYSVDGLRGWATGVAEAPKALVGAIGFSWPLFAAADVLHAPSPALSAALAGVLTLVLTTASRAGARAALHRIDPLQQRTVIVGSGHVAGQLVDKLRIHEQFGLRPVGIVDDDALAPGTPDLPRLGGLRDLSSILARGDTDRVIIAFSRASHEELLDCIRRCRDHGVAVDIIPRLFEFLVGARALDTVGGLPLLSLGTPRLTRSSKIAKRALDIVASSFLLVLLAPLMLLIALAIRLESRGNVLFRQPRVGRSGREFTLVKFRSMYSGAEQRKVELFAQNELADGVMFKIRRDPRTTKVGRLLRRLSLDELPQLINVFRGEMSLVGPRPLIPEESAALAEKWHIRRLDLRPGLTGIWQVQGRSENPFGEMVRLDYQYVAGWSLSRDVEILLATIPAVLSGRGAY